jgi:membrane-bound inhibitor of C-type lysozyme
MVTREPIREQGVENKLRALPILVALILAACHPPAARSEAASPPPRAPQGPVNPDAGVTTYRCVDGSSIVAGYPDSKTAVVTYKDHAYTLKLAPSATGARFTGYGLQWWTKAAHASIAALKPGGDVAVEPGLECAAAPDQPAANPATRTSFTPSGGAWKP